MNALRGSSTNNGAGVIAPGSLTGRPEGPDGTDLRELDHWWYLV